MIASKRRGDTHYRGCWGIGEEADVLVSNWTQFVEVHWNSDIMWQCWISNFPRRKFVVLPSTTLPTCKSFQVLFISSQCVFSFFIHVLCTHCPLCLLISTLCVHSSSFICLGCNHTHPPFLSLIPVRACFVCLHPSVVSTPCPNLPNLTHQQMTTTTTQHNNDTTQCNDSKTWQRYNMTTTTRRW